MASSSSSSSSSTAWLYDVFLSFRGETRKSFTDHLYEDLRQAGVNTFRDNEEIRKGENISDELLKAIEGSKISIIVFSKTYAQSRWCLDELVKILECKKNLQQMVLPIFYNVDPSEVRKQTGEFGKALARHRQRFDDQKVDEWKIALTTVADLSGWDLQTMTNGYESKFIKKITEEVMREVNRTYINVAKYPVGIESRVSDILHLLQTQKHNDIKMFGIFGMGGVGKTTLAKAIYNLSFQKFKSCCFIANIRSQASDGYNGLVRLQETLLCKTLNRKKLEIKNVDEGISLIKQRLRSKSVLIVLDDIDDTSQLESLAGQRNWFGSGSTIIITTRDVQLLSDLEAHEKYMVKTLSPNESLQLLSWQAFGVPIPLDGYIEISERIASYTGGLPLALTIIGSHLRGKAVQEWSDDAEKLEGIPHDDVQKILKISYDSLDGDTRNIFLDIACFFIGHNKNDTSMILEACGFYAKSGIRILIERCLLTTNGSGEFECLEMHDLVRDMGREIVRKESPREPGKQSRLIDPKDVFDVLHGNKGTKAIEGMIVNSNMLKNVPLNTQIFKKMVKLRILILNGTCLSGSFKYLSNELRLLRLHNCHLSCIPSNFRCEKLVELDMEGSNIKEFQCNMRHIKCLKILKFDHCEQLKKTPNFTGAHTLQKVSFMWCSKLVKVHPSIGSLEKLVELDMESCNIKEFQCSMQHFRCLRILKFDYCKQLKKTPNFTGAHTLRKASFYQCSNLVKVHPSIGSLERLVELDMQGCKKLKVLPSSICKLKSLEVLNLNFCVKLRELPIDLGKLEQLRELHAFGTDISHIPFSLGCLRNLKELDLGQHTEKSRDSAVFFPPSVANSCSFEVIENLTSLENLYLSGRSCYLQSLPFRLCHLSNLESLYLEDFKNLRVLVELPPSLVNLSAKNCVSLEKIVTVSNLKKLKALNLENCESLVELPNMESLSSLECLNIRNCNALSIPDKYLHEEDFPIALRSLSSSLNEIDLIGRYYLQSLPLNLCHYSNLKYLCLDDLQNLRLLPQLPPNLEILSAKNCVSLEKIADLSNLKGLVWLDIQNCKSLVEPSGLKSFESLSALGIANCSSLRIPLIEKWFKVHPKDDSVYIYVGVDGQGRISCRIGVLEILVNVIDPSEIDYADDGGNRIDLSVRSKSSGANWILIEPIRRLKRLCFFEVPTTMMGEELEVYVEVHDWQKIFCVAEIHRNREGELRYFPSTRGCIPSYNKEDGERKRKRKVEIGRGGQRRFLPITRGLIPCVMTQLGQDGQRKRKRKVQIDRGGRSIRQRRL
ncbi:TMV resistance protein N-like [Ipomoea triloba]|uniref:TMV resistance protein N-like n=1 Tax=Ipomoea triloba TaxID=35885 RepID=UPI00125D91D5|nr:TMV resistance protein N-like [Ipomoea triloba]XP_031122393.1 TMV resistance protein N-like [Ipomoea triloba]XP_031122394.1 TMV resistance protein N-like [Ipomoea triloba]